MLLRAAGFALLVCGLGLLTLRPQSGEEASPIVDPKPGGFANLPLGFEANRGQASSDAHFIARGNGFHVALGTEGASLTPGHRDGSAAGVAKLRWIDGRRVEPIAAERLPGDANYFIGDDPTGWRTRIPTYGRVRYPEVYPGIDMVYYGTQGHLEYDFVVGPGADPDAIALELTDDSGRAVPFALDEEGSLSAKVGERTLTMRRPTVYQEADGKRIAVEGEYLLLADARIGFRTGPYDRERALVIDPVIAFATSLGVSGSDTFSGLAVDPSGSAYFAGHKHVDVANLTFALVRVVKLNAAGTAILYSTSFGGSAVVSYGGSFGKKVAVDASGQAYVVGYTETTDFPTVNPIQSSFEGDHDGFITKLSADGSTILYSTYFGGDGSDIVNDVAVDAAGSAFITGFAWSGSNFPLLNSLQPFRGHTDAFVAKLQPSGSALVYSTFLGGSVGDPAYAIAVDAQGNAVVAGSTASPDFPVTGGAHQSVLRGAGDAFVASLNAAGTSLRYSTYLGGSQWDYARGLALDPVGNPVVCGETFSADFVIQGGAQATLGGSVDGFVTLMDGVTNFTNILYSTYIGGSGGDSCNAVAIDSARNAYLVGYVGPPGQGPGFPLVRPTQSTFGGSFHDAFYAKLNTQGGPLLYSSYLGGSEGELAEDVALFGSAMLLAGYTISPDFPMVNALQPAPIGPADGIAAKILARADMGISMLDSPDPVRIGNTLTYSIAVTNTGPDAATGVRVTDIIPAGTSLLSATSSQGTCTPGATVVCDLGLVNNPGSASVTIRVIPTQVRVVTNTATVARFEEDTFAANNSRTVTTTVRSRLGVSIAAAPGASGSVASNPAGINCGADCEEFYSSPTTVRLAATPGSGSQFIGWSGACSGTGLCYVLMDQDRSVTATFKRLQ